MSTALHCASIHQRSVLFLKRIMLACTRAELRSGWLEWVGLLQPLTVKH